MQVDYAPFVDRMIHHYEGGFVWNRKDPGGPTKYGVTCYDLAEHRHEVMTSMKAWAPLVEKLSLEEAEDIYRVKYATALQFDALPAGVDAVMMDYGVNSGVSRAVRVASALMGVDRCNTHVDPGLLAALQKCDANKFINAMCAERLRFMHTIRRGAAWVEFGHGWQARVDDLRSYSLHLADTKAPAPVPPRLATPKAIHAPKTAGSVTAGGVVAAPIAAHAAGASWTIALLIAGGIIAAGVGYELYEQHKTQLANAKVHL
ncbi:MAG: hypothetical protein KGL39_41915 [Patescibacteria group bacterium]|nr:hypothetical protein [Patescibacteria group bacterium]